MEKDNETLPQGALSAEKLHSFFINHLNRIYCAKCHLQERLSEIRKYAHYTDLIHAITEIVVDVEQQISRMNRIFSLVNEKPGVENCQGVLGLIEDVFSAIKQQRHDPLMSDLSILFYLQNIESIEMASFKMLKLAVPAIDKTEIRRLLKQNFDEASKVLALLQLITEKYFEANVSGFIKVT